MNTYNCLSMQYQTNTMMQGQLKNKKNRYYKVRVWHINAIYQVYPFDSMTTPYIDKVD